MGAGNNYDQIAEALDGFLKEHPDSKNIVLGVDHTYENDVYKQLADPKVNSVLQSHGMGTLAIESPAAFQDHVNDVMWSGMDPKTFANTVVQDYVKIGNDEADLQGTREAYEAQGELIKAQVKFGNNVMFFDNPDMTLAARDELVTKANEHGEAAHAFAIDKFKEAVPKMTDAMDKAGIERGSNTVQAAENSIRAQTMLEGQIDSHDSDAKKEFDAYHELRLNDKDETLRADHIKSNSIGGAVVIAGVDHGSGKNDLDEKLGAARLAIVPDRLEYLRQSQTDYNHGNQFPDGYLIASEGKIISGEKAFNDAKQFDAQMGKAMDPNYDPAKQNPTMQVYNRTPAGP